MKYDLRKTKIFSPTGSYEITLPGKIVENIDGNVASYWMDGDESLLQISSYLRSDGKQISAKQRLSDRISGKNFKKLTERVISIKSCPDVASASMVDEDGVIWLYVYAVWNNLAIFLTVSAKSGLAKVEDDWALSAINTIRLSTP